MDERTLLPLALPSKFSHFFEFFPFASGHLQKLIQKHHTHPRSTCDSGLTDPPSSTPLPPSQNLIISEHSIIPIGPIQGVPESHAQAGESVGSGIISNRSRAATR
jgi:hypothetical protein